MQNDPNMPKVTPGPIIGLVTAIIGAAVAFGVPITEDQSLALLGLVGALSVAIPGFEAWLRRGRLKYLADKQAASTQAATVVINTPQTGAPS